MPYGNYKEFITKPKFVEGNPPAPVQEWYDKLRNENPTKRVYDVDPYVEVYQFEPNLYGFLTLMLDVGGGLVWQWLIDGPEKAMLIDTGFGLGDLKGLVNEITGGKPIIVANTHCSPDHSYGNWQFDECFSHNLQIPDMEWKQNPGIVAYLLDDDGVPIWADYDPKDMVPWKRYKFTGVPDGHIFDLGDGYEVELVNIPGHQPGHSAYLDKQGRFLIGGDSFPSGGLTGGSDFHADERHARDPFQGSWLPSEDSMRKCTCLRDALGRLEKRLDQFDKIYCGHGIQGLDANIIHDMVETCDQIIADPKTYDGTRGPRFFRYMKNGGMIEWFEGGV